MRCPLLRPDTAVEYDDGWRLGCRRCWEDRIEPTSLIAEPVTKEPRSVVLCLQVCERRDGKGKMTNVMASKRCVYLQSGSEQDCEGDSSQLLIAVGTAMCELKAVGIIV
jgi:hypothetical protein